MVILGADTSTASTTVALRLEDGRIVDARDDPPPQGRPAHVERMLVLADQLLAQARLPWGAVERIAVGVGPGTFTGLRIGVASARALAQSLGVPIVGVSSLQALAAGAESQAQGRPVLAALDARRGELFAAVYEGISELAPPRAIAPQDIGRLLGEAVDAGGGEPPLAVGDGAIRFRSDLQAAGVMVPADAADVHRVSAAVICRLAVDAQPSAPEDVVPDYRRRPDAEVALPSLTSPRNQSPKTSREK